MRFCRAVSFAVVAGCGGTVTEPPAPPAPPAPRVAPKPPAPGDPATAFALLDRAVDIDGKPVGRTGATTAVVVFASWCHVCRDQLAILADVVAAHPDLRVIGLNYRAHERYEGRGGDTEVREYVAAEAPYLVVVPADDVLWSAFGAPPKVPTIFLYDRSGSLVATFDRRTRKLPNFDELDEKVTKASASP
jgi:thiol-disulfide isomerase/thioredoxin